MHLLGQVRRPLRFREGDGIGDYFLGRGEGLSEVLSSLGCRSAEGVQEFVAAGNGGGGGELTRKRAVGIGDGADFDSSDVASGLSTFEVIPAVDSGAAPRTEVYESWSWSDILETGDVR